MSNTNPASDSDLSPAPNDTAPLPELRDALAQIGHLFSEQGQLAQSFSHFVARTTQSEMAQTITQAIYQRDILYAEAGTGTGKTFAYLVPALLYGGRVIVSTASKNLQDQLFNLDLPAIRKALNLPISVALLKGRRNYVCHFHLERNLAGGRFSTPDEARQMQIIKRFSQTSSSGDIASCSDVPERAPVWYLATASRDNCLGTECERYSDCFLMAARKNAMNADVIVVNHHLYFADVAIKDGGAGELLPTAQTVIFDEAHQIPEIASQYFGLSISSAQLMDFSRDLMRDGISEARDGADWVALAQNIEQALREWRVLTHNWQNRLARAQIPELTQFLTGINFLCEQLTAVIDVLENQAERAKPLQSLLTRAEEIRDALLNWQTDDPQYIYWAEVTASSLQLHRTPLSINSAMQEHREKNQGAWIFTSATLAVRKDFSYFADKLGLTHTTSAIWSSPFDYANNGLLYVPQMTAQTHSDLFAPQLVEAITPIIEILQGRMFILCTSLKAVAKMSELLRAVIEERDWTIDVLAQGSKSPQMLLRNFRNNPHSIFIGSYSFWEGVDISGEGLQCVVIDKLPFVVPDDPVLVARLKLLESEGKNGFMDYQVPEATISLKQGAGRLIRGELDKGLLVIGDTRITDKPYGRIMWQSLPPFRRTREGTVARAFVESLRAPK